MRTTWRLIVDGDLAGARNMARDVATLEAAVAGEAPPTLRLYGWNPACLSLGRHQDLTAVDLDFCRREGIDVVRRPTGGRALLHHLELTYSVVAPLGTHPLPSPLQEAYRKICGALVRAARSWGIAAELTGGEVNLHLPGPRTAVPCFKAPAGGEVVVEGRKIIGSSMRARRGFILQHGAILLDWDGHLQAGSMGLSDDSGLRPHVTTFVDRLGAVPDRADLEKSFADAFEEELGIALEPGALNAEETEKEEALLGTFPVNGD